MFQITRTICAKLFFFSYIFTWSFIIWCWWWHLQLNKINKHVALAWKHQTQHSCTWKRRIIMVIPFIIYTTWIFIWIKELGSFIIHLNSKSIHCCRTQEYFTIKGKVFVYSITHNKFPLYVVNLTHNQIYKMFVDSAFTVVL